ncbi:MAG: glycosyltransferase family 9 protein, partial [Advenella sp.]
ERFPEAEIDFLVTNKTAALFANLPVDHVIALTRSAILQPWRALAILRYLRTRRYDLAVQLAPSSLSGVLVSTLLGARYVMGKPKSDAAWYDIKVKDPIIQAYDAGTAFSRALGAVGPVSTQLIVSDQEQAVALSQLQALGLVVNGDSQVASFVAVFVGGHADKVCPLSFWLALIRELDHTGKRFVVFVGPEEKAMIPHLQQTLQALPLGTLCPPKSLRIFAAMLAQARVMVTPDSGPMHMAAALGIPVVVMVQAQKSMGFVPPGSGSQVVWGLNVSEALVAVDRYYYGNNSCAFPDIDQYAQAA